MLHHLLYLFALISLGGAAFQRFTEDKELNISSCPITFYQRVYTQLYVNLTKKNFVICFNNFYNLLTPDDCLLAPKSQKNNFDFAINPPTSFLESKIKKKVDTVSNDMTCYLFLKTRSKNKPLKLRIFSLGNETAMWLQHTPPENTTTTVEVLADGKTASLASVTPERLNSFVDISGCRFLGIAIDPGDTGTIGDICTSAFCHLNRSVTISKCNDWERCNGDGICMATNPCTLTGPAVIDVHNKAGFAGDRCSYTLVSDSWVSGFQILASFRERRRKDVSFVDSVTLRLEEPDVDITLKQDGRVLVNNSPLSLNSSVQELHGVELSKDQTGVHTKVTFSRHSASVFFDGNTAQIYMEGPPGSSLNGLCGNSSSFSSAKLSEDVSSSCETPYTEAVDNTINCSAVTERCNLLKEEPFSSCNTVVDPAPYITTCSQTLCKYPAVDGLRCQFLWAYARACSLSNATLESWRSEAECSAPEAFCQNQVCNDHEFCGEVRGHPACLCRAIFASSYRESNTLGDATVCTQNSASVRLVGCLLVEKNIDYSLLHLVDDTCKGEMDEESGMVTFSFNSSNTCGAVISANNSQVTYKNTIMAQNSSSDVIFQHDQVSIDFSCIHVQPEVKTVTFRIKDSSVVQHITSGEWNYTVTMKAYADANLTQVIDSNTDVVLNQKIWVGFETEGLDADTIAMVTDSCWATGQESSSSTPRYDLIQDGCANAADQTVKVEGNGEGTSDYFSFSMFQFTGSSGDVYLHCKLDMCVKEGRSCIPDCSGGAKKRRRSLQYKYEASAFVSMAWII